MTGVYTFRVHAEYRNGQTRTILPKCVEGKYNATVARSDKLLNVTICRTHNATGEQSHIDLGKPKCPHPGCDCKVYTLSFDDNLDFGTE
jgi:hypothetical protein